MFPPDDRLRHHATVSIIIKYFTAPDDASAAKALHGGPDESVFETMGCGNFLADSAMTEWETLLTGRSPEEHENAEWPRVVADDGPDSGIQVFAASPELQNALAAANRETLAEVAQQWADQYSEDYGGTFEPDTAAEILYELSELSRSANSRKHTLYCWMC